VQWKEGRLGILEMRKHYANYFKGLPNVKEFRDRLVRLEEVTEIEQVFEEMLSAYSSEEITA
jgi:tRNA-dihydrouridine synthase